MRPNFRWPRSIPLATYDGNPIPNEVAPDPLPGFVQIARRQYDGLLRQVQQIGPPSGRYNCHGLSFASRRTNIPPAGEVSSGLIDRILREDRFHQVTESGAQAGDIAIWRNGADVDHSGFVVFVDREERLRTVWIWSMWGGLGEVLHPVQLSPYRECTIEFWRIIPNAV